MQSDDNDQVAFTEILANLEFSVKKLITCNDHKSIEILENLKYIQKQSRYAENKTVHVLIVDKIVRSGIGHVFLKFWGELIKENIFLDEEITSEHDDQQENTSSTLSDHKKLFTNLQLLLSIIWNCSDSSLSLCESLVLSTCINQFYEELSKPQLSTFDDLYLLNESSIKFKQQVYIVKAYLGILHNITRLCSQSRTISISAGAIKYIAPFLKCPNDIIKAKAYLLFSYLIPSNCPSQQANEENNVCSDMLIMADDLACFIVSILRDALHCNNHFSKRYAFSACEIASGLNHLAINDENKVKLGSLGLFKLYAQMLEGDVEESIVAASGVWILSFHPRNKQLLSSMPALLKCFERLAAQSTDENVRRSLRGSLWVVQANRMQETQLSQVEQAHVMISYHWGNQACMLRLRDALTMRGYKVWLDVDNMKGSTLEAMALAIEKSAVILIAMCQEYKESSNCRTEAEYAFRLRKQIIPLLLDRNFSPDGWLGILVGTKLYFDFSEWDEMSQKCSFETQVERLVNEIGPRGRMTALTLKEELKDVKEDGLRPENGLPTPIFYPPSLFLTDTPECDEDPMQQIKLCQPKKFLPSPTPLHGYATPSISTKSCNDKTSLKIKHFFHEQGSNLNKWSCSDVEVWMKNSKLDHLHHKFLGYTGCNFIQLREIQKTAPEFFYNYLSNQLRFELIDILNFSEKLKIFDSQDFST